MIIINRLRLDADDWMIMMHHHLDERDRQTDGHHHQTDEHHQF